MIINCLIYTSNEGFFYSLILILSALFYTLLAIDQKIKIFIIFTFLILLRLFVFSIYDFSLSLSSDDYDFHNIIINLSFENILLITKYILLNLLRTEFLMICVIFTLVRFIYFYKNENNYLFIFILNISFIYSYFLFNSETLEGLLKHNMIPLLFISSPFYILPIIDSINKKKRS